jgi:hypothetical protein
VALDHEPEAVAAGRALTERLGRRLLPTSAAVFVEAHLWIVASDATLSSPTARRFVLFPAQSGIASRG